MPGLSICILMKNKP